GDDSGSVVIGAGGALGIVVSSVEGGGAEVMEVSPGSAGENIGLRAGDKIIAIDGQKVVNSSFISQYVRDKNPGDQVEVTWQTQDGEQSQVIATLDEAEINSSGSSTVILREDSAPAMAMSNVNVNNSSRLVVHEF